MNLNNIKLTVILAFLFMVALIIVTAGVGYFALREAIEDATRYSALARDTSVANDIGSNMLLLDEALDSYLAHSDMQSIWDIEYRLALTRRMAQMAHKSDATPQIKDILVRVDDISRDSQQILKS